MSAHHRISIYIQRFRALVAVVVVVIYETWYLFVIQTCCAASRCPSCRTALLGKDVTSYCAKRRRLAFGAATAMIASPFNEKDAVFAQVPDVDAATDKFKQDILKLSNDLDNMADKYNPIEWEGGGGVKFSVPNPLDYVIGEGQAAKGDLFKGRKESVFNKGLRADPDGYFKQRQSRAVEAWEKLSQDLEAKLAAERPNFQDVRSAVLSKKVPVSEAMSSAAYVLQGGGQDAFDKEQLVSLQGAFENALNQFSRFADACNVQETRRALVVSRSIFEEWKFARLAGR